MQKTVGMALRREREARGISLPEIAREMNISQRYLAALENEDFGQISGDFYVRHYIRCYLRASGADETDFFNRYHDQLQALLKKRDSSEANLYFDKIRFARFRRRRLTVAIALGLLAAAAALLLAPEGWPKSLLSNRPAPPLVLPAPARPAYEGAAVEPDFAALQLEIACTGLSWIRVRRGAELISEGTLTPGATLRLKGYDLGLFIGNPAAVSMRLNGRAFQPALPASGPLRLLLTPADIPPPHG